jgi:two-component system, LuxR family, response regulator FixJ
MVDQATVHIVDDDHAVREALQLLLATESYGVRTYPSALHFLESAEADGVACIVADVRMPGMTGLDLIDALHERGVRLPIILITAHADVPLAVDAMKRGAVDVLEKPFDDQALLSAIENSLCRARDAVVQHSREDSVRRRLATLTRREREVLDSLVKGQSNKLIARDLGITTRTVESHRAALMSKMEARTIAELVQLALTGGENGGGRSA